MTRLTRIATIGAIIAGISVMSNAETKTTGSAYAKGDNIAQIGIGLGTYGSLYGDLGFPMISVLYENGISDLVSIGGGIGYQGSSYGFENYKWTYTYIPIMLRGAFHPFNLPALQKSIPVRDKLDAYGGLTLGYTIVNVSSPAGFSGSYSVGTGYMDLGLLLGARWYFSPNFAVYLEEGSGFAWISLGATLKF